jgi:hypothetical protein
MNSAKLSDYFRTYILNSPIGSQFLNLNPILFFVIFQFTQNTQVAIKRSLLSAFIPGFFCATILFLHFLAHSSSESTA